MTAKSTAREGDGVAEVARHIETLQYLRNDSGPDEPYASALDAAISAMQAQQGAEPVAQAAAFGGLNLGYGFLVTSADLPSGVVYDLVPRGNVTDAAAQRASAMQRLVAESESAGLYDLPPPATGAPR